MNKKSVVKMCQNLDIEMFRNLVNHTQWIKKVRKFLMSIGCEKRKGTFKLLVEQ